MTLQFRRSYHTRGAGPRDNHCQAHVEAIWRAERIYIRQEVSPCLVFVARPLRSHFSCFAGRTGCMKKGTTRSSRF